MKELRECMHSSLACSLARASNADDDSHPKRYVTTYLNMFLDYRSPSRNSTVRGQAKVTMLSCCYSKEWYQAFPNQSRHSHNNNWHHIIPSVESWCRYFPKLPMLSWCSNRRTPDNTLTLQVSMGEHLSLSLLKHCAQHRLSLNNHFQNSFLFLRYYRESLNLMWHHNQITECGS